MNAFRQIAAGFDDRLDGFGDAPTFPQSASCTILFHFYNGHVDFIKEVTSING